MRSSMQAPPPFTFGHNVDVPGGVVAVCARPLPCDGEAHARVTPQAVLAGVAAGRGAAARVRAAVPASLRVTAEVPYAAAALRGGDDADVESPSPSLRVSLLELVWAVRRRARPRRCMRMMHIRIGRGGR